MELSRRNFLKGTGALAGISAMGAIGLGCSPRQTREPRQRAVRPKRRRRRQKLRPPR